MTPRDFLQFATQLTGTEVKGEIDSESLADILIDDGRPIDCSQLNELLLFVHKDRVEEPSSITSLDTKWHGRPTLKLPQRLTGGELQLVSRVQDRLYGVLRQANMEVVDRR